VSSSAPVTNARRRPKGDKRARTRARLIEAAIELIRADGYEGLTLAAVAARAGMTTGAIYGNFQSRTDLLMAVARVSGAPIVPNIRPGMSLREFMLATADAVIESLPQRRAAMVGTLGFHIEQLTHEELRERSSSETADIYRRFSIGVGQFIPAEQLPMPPEQLVPAMHALVDGLVLHRILTPELVPDEVIRAAFEALAAGSPEPTDT